MVFPDIVNVQKSHPLDLGEGYWKLGVGAASCLVSSRLQRPCFVNSWKYPRTVFYLLYNFASVKDFV